MRIIVDRARCVGHGLCESFAPEVFEIDDGGDLVIADGAVDGVADELIGPVEQAIASCPTEALSWASS